MDKNLKADLVAFRNEVISNIKNIEDVVGKIDDKLQDETTTSCLSRCPEIADLLEQCKTVKWHPDVDQQQVVNFTKSVNKVYDRLSIIQSSKFAEHMSDIVRLSNRLESKFNEQTKKEITQLAEKQVSSTQDEIHNNDTAIVKHAEKSTLEKAKFLWLWDNNDDSFNKLWNQDAEYRIIKTIQAIQETTNQVEVFTYKSPIQCGLNKQDIAKLKHDTINALLPIVKPQILNLLKGNTVNELQVLLESCKQFLQDNHKTPKLWYRYYDIVNELIQEITQIGEVISDAQPLVTHTIMYLKAILDTTEYIIRRKSVQELAEADEMVDEINIDHLAQLQYNQYTSMLEAAYSRRDKEKIV